MRSFEVAAAMNVAAVNCSSRRRRGAGREFAGLGIGIARGDAGRDHHVVADGDVVEAQHARPRWRCARRLSGPIRGPLVGALQPICICSSRLNCAVGADSTRCRTARHGNRGADAMDFGIHFGTRGCLASRDNIMAAGAARPRRWATRISASPTTWSCRCSTACAIPTPTDGVWPGAPTGECFDAIATLAFLAGCTQRIKLLTSVVGRAVSAGGAGGETVPDRRRAVGRAGDRRGRRRAGCAEEFAALGTPPFDERGAVTDEYLQAWKTLWTRERPALHGKYVAASTTWCSSRSRCRSRIRRSGSAAKARRRCGARCGSATPGIRCRTTSRCPLNTPARLQAGIAACIARRRRPDAIRPRSISATCGSCRRAWTEQTEAGWRRGRLFTGSAADMLADAAALARPACGT